MAFMIGSGLVQHAGAAGGGGGIGDGGTSQAYLNFAARYATPPTETVDNAYGTFLDGLTTDGFFNGSGTPLLLSAIWLMSTDQESNAVLNLCSSSYPLVKQNSPSFVSLSGWTLNGSTQFLKTGFVPTTDSLWTSSGASFGTFGHTNRTVSQAGITMGAQNAGTTDTSQVLPFFTGGGHTVLAMCQSNVGIGLDGISTSRGMVAATNTGSVSKAYRYVASGTPTSLTGSASAVETAEELYIGGRNNNTVFDNPTDDMLGAAFAGGLLNDTQMNNLAARINQYMIDVSAPYHW